ncbi:DUF3617 domain-containing protein [Phenylobacterium sp.]|uniref:DUF3617 domain-containing protein n=1 Tax=Phenylobacterium sp. TaxID=1871053 RepID=UPI00286CB763|nr:DUF3617 domain-containing protein [Phenylobacterium sp.]
MIRIRHLALVGAALLIAPASASAQASGVNPGQWEIAVTINAVNGGPPMVAKMMTGKTIKVKHCISPEEAARGPQDMLKSDKSCTFNKYSMSNGKMNSDMTCRQGDTTTHTISSGTFTPTGFTAAGRATMTGAMPMTMTSTSVGRRLGDCRK